MILIAAVDRNWSIGRRGELLVRIPLDQKRFQSVTMGGVVIMGRKTFESLPNPGYLPDRKNVVLTKDVTYKCKNAMVVHSVDECVAYIKTLEDAGVSPDRIFCIGGGQVYSLLLPYCDRAFITMIDYDYEADTHMPCLDELPDWTLEEESDEMTYFDLEFYFRTYVRT